MSMAAMPIRLSQYWPIFFSRSPSLPRGRERRGCDEDGESESGGGGGAAGRFVAAGDGENVLGFTLRRTDGEMESWSTTGASLRSCSS